MDRRNHILLISIFFISIAGTLGLILVVAPTLNENPTHSFNYTVPNNKFQQYAYMPHYVRFHIVPENENISVSMIPSEEDNKIAFSIFSWYNENISFDVIPSFIGETNNKSDAVATVVGGIIYNISINNMGGKCNYKLIFEDITEYTFICPYHSGEVINLSADGETVV